MRWLLRLSILTQAVVALSLSRSAMMTQPHTNIHNNKNVRIELFFKNGAELQNRLDLLSGCQYDAVNLVNKHRDDALLEWVQTVTQWQQQQQQQNKHCCVHYSLKFQKVPRGTIEQQVSKLEQFLQDVETNNNRNKNSNTEVLLVSGSVQNDAWNTVVALQKLQERGVVMNHRNVIAVAYNPFFPNEQERQQERQRLQQKLDTGLVSKVYLQFGTDLALAKACCLDLRQLHDIPVCASIFLPTKQLIAQQKFRPWKGVFLSDEFLQTNDDGCDQARQVVVELMRLYQKYNVELLVEAPGVRKPADLELIASLLAERDAAAAAAAVVSSEQETATTTTAPAPSSPEAKNKRRRVEASEVLPVGVLGQEESVQDGVSTKPAIVLFGSHDLRLHDNQALQQAAERHSQILPVVLWHTSVAKWGVRGAAQVVYKEALRHLAETLRTTHDLPLVCRTTADAVQELCDIVQQVGAGAVYYNRELTTDSRVMDRQRGEALGKFNVQVIPCQSFLLYDIEKVDLKSGFHSGHWGTLMPFLKACQKQFGSPSRPESSLDVYTRLKKVQAPSIIPYSVSVDDLDMAVMPPRTKWDEPIRQRFPMTAQAAQQRLDEFFLQGGLDKYESERSRADKDLATSQLSVYLRFGTLSPNELYWRTEDSPLTYDHKKVFARRLFWRDLAYFQLLSFPNMPEKSIREHYENTEWVSGEEESRRLRAWQKGATGYPMVDAGMRELYATGWMTQSVRMVVASFLCEYLRIHWTHGAAWFHDTLADADVAINSMMWQNAGRSGTDQWNFVLSPENASQDPTGVYTRKWVPELSQLSNQYLHTPWLAPEDTLRVAGVSLGETYPHRIVEDLKAERAKSVENVLEMRRRAQDRNNDRGYDLISLPDGRKTVVFTKKEYRIGRDGNVLKQESKPKRQPSAKRGRGSRRRRT